MLTFGQWIERPSFSRGKRVQAEVIVGMPETVYHADPAPDASLSRSAAVLMHQRSPRHAYDVHPRLGGKQRPSTDAYDFGTLVHALLLGDGDDIEAIDAPDYRTKVAREKRDAARAANKVPVLAHKLEPADEAACLASMELLARGMWVRDPDAYREVTFLWERETAHGPIWCRARLDYLSFHGGYANIWDLKTTQSADVEYCARVAHRYGYDVQAAAYVDAVETAFPEFAGRCRFRLAYLELNEPTIAVACHSLGPTYADRGRRIWHEMAEKWGECMADNNWPGYDDGLLIAPGWLESQENARHYE